MRWKIKGAFAPMGHNASHAFRRKGQDGGEVAGHLKLKFKLFPSMGDGSGLEPDWYLSLIHI